MQLNYWWKDEGSGGGGCPALYGADLGHVVQGKLPHLKEDPRPGYWVLGIRLTDPADRAQLRDVLTDEDAVWVLDLPAAITPDTEPVPAVGADELVLWVPENLLDMSRTPVGA